MLTGPPGAVGGQIMRSIGITALGALLCLSAPAKAELLVKISKSQQRVAVVIDGTEAYRWPISTGRRGHETPSGSFHPVRIERHWYSHQYSLTPMPWSVFFHRGYAMHGTMEAYNLGHAASHGCVRLRPDKAAILFSLVRREGLDNTKVVVMNGPLPAPPGATPMADAGQRRAEAPVEQHFAMALPNADEPRHLSAKTHVDAGARHEHARRTVKRKSVHVAGAERYRVSIGGDEARVLREREAWLRSLDRKYGFTR
jgi:L,D-transpeptidase catalytic domain